MHVLQFLVVGASGTVINLVILSLALAMGLAEPICLAAGIGVSVVTNFLLNRRFTFSYAKDGNIIRQFGGFLSASAVGLSVNYFVALYLSRSVLSDGPYSLQLAAVAGIACGMAFNFIGNRFFVFRKRYVRKKPE
jgi:dolichol-phosphate mannosyltransferase